MYSAISDQADQLAIRFCAEAERLWQIEQENGTDSVLNLAAAEFLSLGYLGQGRDHSVLRYLKEAANMGSRMSLFAVGDQDDQKSEDVRRLGNFQLANVCIPAAPNNDTQAGTD